MNIQLQKVNTLPMPTWRWLKINDTNIELNLSEFTSTKSPVNCFNHQDIIKENTISNNNIKTAIGDEVENFILKNTESKFTLNINENTKIKHPIIIEYNPQNHEYIIDEILINAKENSSAKFIFIYSSDLQDGGLVASNIRINADANSNVEIIQLQSLGQNFTSILPIGVDSKDNSNVKVSQLNLGASKSYLSCDIESTNEVQSVIDSLYITSKNQELDINYLNNIYGKKVNSQIKTNGILLHNAKKTMRGTLDFKRGSKESVGNESENVLLLDSNVVNKSIPLILCGEDNIEGNHSASIGQMDEEQLFYLYSRGLSDSDIRNMQINAIVYQIQSRLPDSLHHYVEDYAKEAFSNE